MNYNFKVDPDIRKAETLPSKFYMDESIFTLVKSKIFLKSWQWIGHENLVERPNSVYPFTLMENFLDEPMLLTKDENEVISCLSNVCTHRGNLLSLKPAKSKNLVCFYHGRRFNLRGKFEHMPEFDQAKGFPRECDNLYRFSMERWGPFCLQVWSQSMTYKKFLVKLMSESDFFL